MEFQSLDLSDERGFLLASLAVRAGLRMADAFENMLDRYIEEGREAMVLIPEILKDIQFNAQQEE